MRRLSRAKPSLFSYTDRLILEAATGARRLSQEELQHILEHIIERSFDPDFREQAGGRLAGLIWQGRTLRSSDGCPLRKFITCAMS